MNNLTLTKDPVAKAEMLIRRPVAEVFAAFIHPEITTKFWFTRSSGRIEAGKQVTWYWKMYAISVPVNVREVEENKRILIDWGNYDSATTVEWIFTPYGKDATYVSITNFGFKGDGDKVVRDALDSTAGFTTVLDGAKAWLEHNINLNLIADSDRGVSSMRPCQNQKYGAKEGGYWTLTMQRKNRMTFIIPEKRDNP